MNNWCMGDFAEVARAQAAFADRIVYVVDDFAPLNVGDYYAELLRGFLRRGSVITAFPSPMQATDRGRTVTARRDAVEVGRDCWRSINEQLGTSHG